ncbi:MAG: hypothetical protein IKN66_04085 [Ruminococcus sp.]|nr:hypothetical protein [Ruminococcus sp.]
MAKKILQVFLVLLFIVLVVCGIIIGSYVFSSPDTDADTDSRQLITGPWIDEKADKQLEFDENGNFKYSEYKSGNVIAEGFYRINEDRKVIKLFMFPGNHTEAFDPHVNLLFFAQIGYSDLQKLKNEDYYTKRDEKNYKPEDAPTCTFLVKNAGENDGVVLNMTMPKRTLDLYSKGKKFSAKKK